MAEVTWEDLVKWSQTQGALWNAAALELRTTGPRGRGVFARRKIKAGEVLLRLPSGMAIYPAPVFDGLIQRGECHVMLGLVLTALHEMSVKQPPDPFFAFLNATLPPPMPMLWTKEEIEQLIGTTLLPADVSTDDVAKAALSAYKTDVEPLMHAVGEAYLPSRVCTRAAFTRALALVLSHAVQGRVAYEHGPGGLWPYLRADGPSPVLPGGSAGPFLLPLFDQLNHSSDSADLCTRLTRAGEQQSRADDADASGARGHFEMRAERDIEQGEEILHSCARAPNPRTLAPRCPPVLASHPTCLATG